MNTWLEIRVVAAHLLVIPVLLVLLVMVAASIGSALFLLGRLLRPLSPHLRKTAEIIQTWKVGDRIISPLTQIAKLALASIARGARGILHKLPYAAMALFFFLGLWIVAAVVLMKFMPLPSFLVYAGGALLASLPISVVGWPILKIVSGEKPKLAEFPTVVAVAALLVAPLLAMFPLLASD